MKIPYVEPGNDHIFMQGVLTLLEMIDRGEGLLEHSDTASQMQNLAGELRRLVDGVEVEAGDYDEWGTVVQLRCNQCGTLGTCNCEAERMANLSITGKDRVFTPQKDGCPQCHGHLYAGHCTAYEKGKTR